ncbi:MAG: hypothetical protein CMJ58_21180 [Planctomycetaceae bacterium]|nr:hypothetical protein [Planctomycetaceae bacterium]
MSSLLLRGLPRPASFSAARLAGALVQVSLLATGAAPAAADDPAVAFDFARTVECHELDPAEAPALYPGEKAVECTLRVSVNLLAGNAGQIEELRVEATDPDRRLRVLSFSPQTTLASEFTGPIERTTTNENGHALGLSLGGEIPAPIGNVVAHVAPSANGTLTDREVVTEKECRVPPKQTIIAAGTIDEAHGVFFKVRPSSQTTLEGMHEFTVRLIVPENWRGDALRITCSASGTGKMLWVKQHKTWARTAAETALYLAGDAAARQAAQRYVSR